MMKWAAPCCNFSRRRNQRRGALIAMPFSNDSSQYAGRLEQLLRRTSQGAGADVRNGPTDPVITPPQPVAPAVSPPPTFEVPTIGQSVYPDFLAAPRELKEAGLTETMVEDHIIRT